MAFGRKKYFDRNDIQSIISACITGNYDAQNTLIDLYLGYAKNVCFPYVSNKEEAEEVINDGFLKMFNNLANYDHSRPFKSWFKAILINTAIDHYRKNGKRQQHLNIDSIELAYDNPDIIGKISADEILLLIQRLPPSYRIVFNLFVVEGYTHREISEMLDIGEGTSKSNLRDARKKLQSMICQNYPQLFLAYTLKTTRINEN